MADDIDRASERELETTQANIDEARSKASKPEAEITGDCLWCGESVNLGSRWCDKECREIWQLKQDAKRRAGI